MRNKILWTALVFTAIQAVGSLVGLVISNRMRRGDETSDDFQIAAVMGGRKFQSQAATLRSASVIATMGGVGLDLRDATLDEAGATLELRATMGGAEITVPENWAVDVDIDTRAGGVELDVTPVEDLPDDAPRLHIRGTACMGGAHIVSHRP